MKKVTITLVFELDELEYKKKEFQKILKSIDDKKFENELKNDASVKVNDLKASYIIE